MKHVGADGMAPMYISKMHDARTVLIEHVVFAIPVNRPVGIIHPVSGREQVILRTQNVVSQSLTQRWIL